MLKYILYLCGKIMKKSIVIIALSLLTLAFASCQKYKYCQCYAVVDGEDIGMGEDLEVTVLTEEQIAALNTNNDNLYVMEHGTCNDKAKEFTGWGQVTCREVDPKDPDGTWYERIFNQLFGGGTNNNSNNNSGNNGKP